MLNETFMIMIFFFFFNLIIKMTLSGCHKNSFWWTLCKLADKAELITGKAAISHQKQFRFSNISYCWVVGIEIKRTVLCCFELFGFFTLYKVDWVSVLCVGVFSFVTCEGDSSWSRAASGLCWPWLLQPGISTGHRWLQRCPRPQARPWRLDPGWETS